MTAPSNAGPEAIEQAIVAAQAMINRPLTDNEREGIRRVQTALSRHAAGWHQLTFSGRILDGLVVLGCEWCPHRTLAPRTDGIRLSGSRWVRAHD